MSRWYRIVLAVLVVASAAGWFLLSTVLADEVPDAVLVAAAALGMLGVALATGLPSRARLSAIGGPGILTVAAAGSLVGFAAPLVVMSNRLTDAPPGSVTLFFTTAVWGVLAIVASAAVARLRPTALQIAFSLVGLLGVAALLANWERPSSFSPLVRYPAQELGFVLAGALWVAGGLALVLLTERFGRSTVLAVAGSAASILALGFALVTEGAALVAVVTPAAGVLMLAALSYGVFVFAWLELASAHGPVRASALWFLPALAVTAISVYEQAFNPRGPDPVVWIGATGGMLLAAAAVDGIWAAPSAAPASPTEKARLGVLGTAATVAGVIALVVGLVSLALPAFRASVIGTLAGGGDYEAKWFLLGWESAGGWIAPLAGALLLIGVSGLREKAVARSLWAAAGAGVTLAAYALVAATPLRTWNRWVPVEIQSEYGTEYTLLEFTLVHDVVRMVALVAGALGVLLLVLAALQSRRPEPVPVRIEDTRP